MNAEESLIWDKPHFYLKGEIFVPHIYAVKEMHEINQATLQGYNTVSIDLDGKVSADLDWSLAEKMAQKVVEEERMIIWNLDLGLFHQLKASLSNQSQFLSLLLSLEHFRDTLWVRFKNQTVGVCLYNGPANFAQQLFWDDHLQTNYLNWKTKCTTFEENDSYWKKLFARDAAAEYLHLLVNQMPDALQFFAVLNVLPEIPLHLQLQLTHRERFDRFHLIIKNCKLGSFLTEESKIAICLPGYQVVDPACFYELEEVLQNFLAQQIKFRMIPENDLINEWHGLDYIVVMPLTITAAGKRKLQGFCAAGGTVVTTGDFIGLPQEISLLNFYENVAETFFHREGAKNAKRNTEQ